MPTLSRALVRAIKNNETASFVELNGIDQGEGHYQRLAFLFKRALHEGSTVVSLSLANVTADNAWLFIGALKSPVIHVKHLTLYRFDQVAARLIEPELGYFSPSIKSLKLVGCNDAACAILYDALCLMKGRFEVRCRGVSPRWGAQFKTLNEAVVHRAVFIPPALSNAVPHAAQGRPYAHRCAALEQQCTEQQSLIHHLQQENAVLKSLSPPSYASICGALANPVRPAIVLNGLPAANP